MFHLDRDPPTVDEYRQAARLCQRRCERYSTYGFRACFVDPFMCETHRALGGKQARAMSPWQAVGGCLVANWEAWSLMLLLVILVLAAGARW